MLDWNPVQSSVIQSVAYDRGNLYVKFISGTMYVYFDVPNETFVALGNAPSKGSYLDDNIKGKYAYEKLT